MKHKIRNNILLLNKYLKEIKTFKSLGNLDNFLINESNKLSEQDANDLKGAMWENFSDHLCDKESSLTGLTNIIPATPDEDYFLGLDGWGETTYASVDLGVGEKAIKQDKWKNPYAKNEKGRPVTMTWDTISRSVKLVCQGKLKAGRVCIITNLPLSMISQEVKDIFTWIVARDHYEVTLENNLNFWKTFADKIKDDCKRYQSNAKSIIQKEKDDIKKQPMLDFQKEFIDHAIKNQHSFNKAPPRSGKTKIQGGLIEKWLKA